MKKDNPLTDILLVFFITTACNTILEGTLGTLLLPAQRFGYIAFLSPPLFALLTASSGLVMLSRKELTIRQVIVRRILQLIWIEAIVFGLNLIAGIRFEPVIIVSLSLGIAAVFVTVNLMMWLNDRRIASNFNKKLRAMQDKPIHDSDKSSYES
jgi:hypothetical protein